MTPPDLVIFDCDGVLVDSEPITNRLLAVELTAHGLPTTPEEAIEKFVGGTLKSVFEHARSQGANLPDDWLPGFYDLMIDTLAKEVEIIPGADHAVAAVAAAGIARCVASNGPMRKIRTTLGRTGLLSELDGKLFSAHDVGIAKPDPGLFLHAAGGISPDRCVVIEDSASGARAAQAAGMRCLGYTGDTPAAKLVAHGAEPFDDMAALPTLLGIV